MNRRVCVVDADLLLVYLGIHQFETAGPESDRWDRERVDDALAKAKADGYALVLPYAVMVEVGNHVTQARRYRKRGIAAYREVLEQIVQGTAPWILYDETPDGSGNDILRRVIDGWPEEALRGVSFGDYAIRTVVDRYQELGCDVQVLSGEPGLRAYQSPGQRGFTRARRNRKRS